MKYLKVAQGLIIFYNKDNSEIHIEEIKANNELASVYQDRAKEIYDSPTEPERKWNDSSFFRCRLCSFRERCYRL